MLELNVAIATLDFDSQPAFRHQRSVTVFVTKTVPVTGLLFRTDATLME